MRVRWAGGVILLLAAARASAQPAPGSEFLVNTYSTSVQSYSMVATDARGGFVVVWVSYTQDGDRRGVFARRFDRRGAARTPEIAVNEVTTGLEWIASVGSDAAGNFVVAWLRSQSPPFVDQVVARRFDRTGAALGPEFLVGGSTTSSQITGSLAMQPDGRFLVAWTQVGPPSISGRRFTAGGSPVGSELVINTTPTSGSNVQAVAAPDGGYLVTWSRAGSVYSRRIDAAGDPVGVEFRVNASTAGFSSSPAPSFDESGAFVVAWNQGPTSLDLEIFARRFDVGGTPIGVDFQVNLETPERQCCPGVVSDRDGGFTVFWTGKDVLWDVYGRRFGPGATPLEPDFLLPAVNGGFQVAEGAARAPGGQLVVTWSTEYVDGDLDAVVGRLLGVAPMAMTVDVAPMQSNGNGVLEAGETVAVAPAWANADRTALNLAGTMSSFAGPGASTYTIVDGTGNYGSVAVGSTSSCTGAADCYALAVSTPPTRPALHWDATVRERVSPRGDMTWPIHVGGSFTDVPLSSAYYRFIETVLHHGVTAGCAADTYCPAAASSRDQMAVFVLLANEGPGYQPRACATPVFPDLPATSPFCRFVEELARRGVVSGCGGGNYCPGSPVTRQEMAVFVLRTKEPTFTPPACTTPMFADVPASSPFCRWIEELARRGVVSGCGGGNYCPDAPVTREQMAVFISGGFGLTLYGP